MEYYRFRVLLNKKRERNMKKQRVEKHNINKNSEFYYLIDDVCWKSKNLYNYANYIIRQEFIKTSKEKDEGERDKANWIRYNELYKLCKESEPYNELGSVSGQQTLKLLDKNWKSFFESIKDWSKNPQRYTGRPKLPKYLNKEKGRYICVMVNQNCKIVDGFVHFGWKRLKDMNGHFHTNVPDDAKLCQIRFVPKGDFYVMEIVYEIEVDEIAEDMTPKRIAAIDLGINNLMTVTTNCGTEPIVVNGKPLKSMNQYYNKEISRMRSDLKLQNDKNWSNKMQQFTSKKNKKVDDYIHKATKMVIDYCIENDIDTLVCGYNQGWKQDSDIGKVNNQKFVCIPHLLIVQRLKYKCENIGIKFIDREESYTSGTSFIDNEVPNKENYDKSRRVHRGLFISNEGIEINADVNASYQILKKAFPNAFDTYSGEFEYHPRILNVV